MSRISANNEMAVDAAVVPALPQVGREPIQRSRRSSGAAVGQKFLQGPDATYFRTLLRPSSSSLTIDRSALPSAITVWIAAWHGVRSRSCRVRQPE